MKQSNVASYTDKLLPDARRNEKKETENENKKRALVRQTKFNPKTTKLSKVSKILHRDFQFSDRERAREDEKNTWNGKPER